MQDTQINRIYNKVQDLLTKVDLKSLVLPQIVVVGGQSAGKSSVLESIVGQEFLPKGNGMMTRSPVMLHLVYCPPGDELRIKNKAPSKGYWATFEHSTEVFTDFTKVCREIENRTATLAPGKEVTNVPIILTIYSETNLNLSLVDLPGLVQVAVNGQPDDIKEQIEGIVADYIGKPKSIILAVSTITEDFATSVALKAAKDKDLEGKRTVAVFTKLNKVREPKEKMDELSTSNNLHVDTKIAVINRDTEDSNSRGITMEQARKYESEFFEKHHGKDIASRNGVGYLRQTLSDMLTNSFRQALPALKNQVRDSIREQEAVLCSLGKVPTHSERNKALSSIISEFAKLFVDTVRGNNQTVVDTENVGGAQLAYFINHKLGSALEKLDPNTQLTDEVLEKAIRKATALKPVLQIPHEAFEELLKVQIDRMREPSLQCLRNVYEEMDRVLKYCASKSMELQRFQNIYDKLYDVVSKLLSDRITPTQIGVNQLVCCHMAYININHPHFVDKASKMVDKSSNLFYLPKVVAHSGCESNATSAAAAPNGLPQCINLLRSLICIYFDIVRVSLQDMVPKAIIYGLVNYTEKHLCSTLIEQMHTGEPKSLDILFREQERIAKQRADATKRLQVLEKTDKALSELANGE